jgi:group I intron endonuclease
MKEPNRERKSDIKAINAISLNEEQKENVYGFIYKITSPSKKCYIGKTINLKQRYNKYKNQNIKSQNKIYNSIKKYGWENHIFEIIDVVYNSNNSKNELANLEIYYIDKFNSFTEGLNLSLGGEGVGKGNIPFNKNKKGVYTHSQESKQKISLSLKGIERTDDQKLNYKISKLGDKNPMFNKIQSKETKLKKSLNHSRSIKLINTITGEKYNSIKEAAIENNIHASTLRYSILVKKTNNFNIKIYEGE